MTGERWAWFELADRQHLPLQECQDSTTSTEFLDWMYFIQEKERLEAAKATKQDHYLAQIAVEIYNFRQCVGAWVKDPKLRTLEEMLLKFGPTEENTAETKEIPTPRKARTAKPEIDMEDVSSVNTALEHPGWKKTTINAKSSWAARFGLGSLDQLQGRLQE